MLTLTQVHRSVVRFLRRPRIGVFAGSCLLGLAITSPAAAINIILNFNAAANQAPAFDPAATGLQALFEHAESFYQDVFEDTHTITINYWYEDLADSTLGVHTLVSEGGVPSRENEGNIRIDTRVSLGGALRNWFIDSTPDNNSEFTMQQTLWRDLSGAQQTDFYNNIGAAVPDTFEAGFTGAATAGGGASGLTDMLSVVMHEVGHAIGMSSANNSTVAQTADSDYDFNTAFIFGQTLAAEVADGGNIAHLDNSNALMFPSIGTSERTLPSHTDLFSMASGHAYTALDVPRREFYGGSNWNTDGNWSGDTIPGAADEVFVRNPGSVVTANLSANGFAADLHVSEGGNVDTESFRLDVGGTVTISDVDSDIFVRTGGELEAATIQVENNAELNVEGGLVDANTIVLTQGTTLTFLQGTGGTVDVQTTLNNNATVRASFGGSLTFTSAGGSVWDLDGTTGNGVVQAVLGDLNFSSGSLNDAFDGDMTIGDGTAIRTLTIAEPWTLGSGGVLELDGGTTSAERAVLAGGTLTATTGDINANGGVNWINSPAVLGGSLVTNTATDGQLEFNGSTTVSGGTFNSTGTGVTQFDGTTSYPGGTVTLTGVLSQNGSASVTGATTIQGDIFNFDGNGATTWTLTNDLTLNVTEIDNSGETFDGTININNSSSTLTVNTPAPWTLDGTTNITTGTDLTFPSVAGQQLTASGIINVNGGTRFDATVRLTGTINLLTNTSIFSFNGGDLPDTNRIEGGVVNGPAGSRLRATTSSSLTGFGTINSGVDFTSGTALLADDGTLDINGALVGLGLVGTADNDGILDIAVAWNTSLADELRLQGGTVTGGGITNDGTTTGRGLISSASFTNNASVSANGGTLVLNPTSFPDLDGTTETGVLNAENGDLHVLGAFGGQFAFDGTMNVGAGRVLRIPATSLNNSGTINLNSGEFVALGLTQSDTLNVSGAVTSRIRELGGSGAFNNGSQNNLNGNLALNGSFLIRSGANFGGTGRIIVDSLSQLRLENGANVGVGVNNLGRAEVGNSPGIALVAAFSQAASGTYEAEIDGQLVGTQYDQLQVTGDAILGGTLEILINQNGGAYADPVAPGTFHAFTLISAGNVAGDFDTVTYAGAPLVPEFGVSPSGDFVALASCGLFRAIDYSTTDMQLINYRSIPGDANGDGFVDGTDFGIWNSNKFTVGTDYTSGDFNCDGLTDGTDFGIWNSNKFTGTGLPRLAGGDASVAFVIPSALSLSVVPEPSSGIWMTLVTVASLFRRKRSLQDRS
jgi:hypothetical protein